MGFRFRKSIKAGPLRINVSKSGVGYSVGGKGYRVTKKAGGGVRTTTSIPGTGISYVKDYSSKKKTTNAKRTTSTSASIQRNATQTPKEKRKFNWKKAAGIFCAFGSVVMLIDGVLLAALTYAAIALLLLWKRPAAKVDPTSSVETNSTPTTAISRKTIYPRQQIAPAESGEESQVAFSAPKPDSPQIIYPRKQASQDKNVQAIVDSLHNGTFQETIQELYGESYTEPKSNSAIVPESDTTPIEEPQSSGTASEAEAQEAAPQVRNQYKTFTAKATGMSYYISNIENLAVENPDYDMSKKEIIDNFMTDERIYEYKFFASKVNLVPEPENIHDPNAVKVIVDGEHVGYIKAGSCSRILKILREDRLHRVEAEIGGGKYKLVYEDYDDDTYKLERGKTEYFVHLTIYEKNSTDVASTVSAKRHNTYALNPQTMVIHRTNCTYIKKIDAYYTDSKDLAILQGYRPCKYCNP